MDALPRLEGSVGWGSAYDTSVKLCAGHAASTTVVARTQYTLVLGVWMGVEVEPGGGLLCKRWVGIQVRGQHAVVGGERVPPGLS